jgi:hypothetical protein
MDPYSEQRQHHIFISVFVVCLVLVGAFLLVTKAFAAPGDSETDPIMDGFETFPIAFRCPDQPHETQTCEPGKWYFGSLIGSSDFDDWIGAHAGSNKWQAKYEAKSDLLKTTKALMQSQIDAYKQRVIDLEADVLKNAKLMRWNSTVAFIAGSVIFTALTVAITAIVYQIRNDIEETVSNESGVQASPGLVWRLP